MKPTTKAASTATTKTEEAIATAEVVNESAKETIVAKAAKLPTHKVAVARPKQTVLTGTNALELLGGVLSKLKIGVPELEILNDMKTLKGTVAEKLAAVETIRGGIADALSFKLKAYRQYNACTDRVERKFVAEELEQSQLAADSYLKKVLEMEGSLGSVAAVTYIKSVLTMEYETSKEVDMMLKDLVAKKLLVSKDKGCGERVSIGYNWYEIGDYGLDAEDIDEIVSVIEQFSKVVKTMERQRREAMNIEMAAKANISLADALLGCSGTCLVHIPAEAFELGGVTKWRGGGDVSLQFKDKYIKPVCASGSIERLIADIGSRGAELTRHSLTWNTAPPFQGLVKDIQRNHPDFSRDVAEDYARDFMTMWHMLRRGIKHAENIVAQEASLQEMSKKAEISAIQFFGLNGNAISQEQAALLQFDGILKMKDVNLINPFFLATRKLDDGKDFIEVLEVPEHLNEYLGNITGKKFPINHRDTLLGELIQKIKGQTEMAAATATTNH